MNCSLLGTSAHRSLQARILEWVAISVSRSKEYFTADKYNSKNSTLKVSFQSWKVFRKKFTPLNITEKQNQKWFLFFNTSFSSNPTIHKPFYCFKFLFLRLRNILSTDFQEVIRICFHFFIFFIANIDSCLATGASFIIIIFFFIILLLLRWINLSLFLSNNLFSIFWLRSRENQKKRGILQKYWHKTRFEKL